MRIKDQLAHVEQDLDSIALNLARIADSLEMAVRITKVVLGPLRYVGIEVPR